MPKHGWHEISGYFQVHDTVISKCQASGFVETDGLKVEDYGDGFIVMSGSLGCGCLRLEVTKSLEVREERGAKFVRTVAYSYNVSLSQTGCVLRYCSPHADHNQHHHKHTFDVLAGDRQGSVSSVPDGEWPTIGEVLAEAEAWQNDNYDALCNLGLISDTGWPPASV